MKSYIILTGIFERKAIIEALNRLGENKNFTVELFNIHWLDNHESFDQGLTRLLSLVKEKINQGNEVNLIGLSAGGVLGLVAYNQTSSEISSLTTVCTPINNKYVFLRIGQKLSKKFRKALDKVTTLDNSIKANCIKYIAEKDNLVPRINSDFEDSKIINRVGHFKAINSFLFDILPQIVQS